MVVYFEAKLLLCEPHIVIYTVIMKVYGISMYTICVSASHVLVCLSQQKTPIKKLLPLVLVKQNKTLKFVDGVCHCTGSKAK